MGIVDDAKAVIDQAEARLRELLATAVAQGDYDAVMSITDWAMRLRSSRMEASSVATTARVQPVDPSPKAAAASRPSLRSMARRKNVIVSASTPRAPEYPRFLRDSDGLVKVGWSKTNSEPYEHKAPKSVVDAIVNRVDEVGSKHSTFDVESLGPIKSGDGSDIPSYQVYVCLAWLRLAKLVTQHGRKGYSLSNGAVASQVETAWRQLPGRKAD